MTNKEFDLIVGNFTDIKTDIKDIKTDVKDIKEKMITKNECSFNQDNCSFVKKNEFRLKITKIIISGITAIIIVIGTYIKIKGS